MRKIFTLFMLLFFLKLANGQSQTAVEVFRLLPDDKVMGLSVAVRDTLLQGTYYPPDNDTDHIEAYNYGYSSEADDYLYVSFSFETGQRGTAMVEIRCFKTSKNDYRVLVSHTSGVPNITYSQADLSVYTYTKKKQLIPYHKKILPDIDETIFIKPGIPDSVKKVILNNSNLSYDLHGENISAGLHSPYLSDNEQTQQWLKGDTIYFTWKRNRFVPSSVSW